MAEYLEIDISLHTLQDQDYLIALMADFGFDGFREDEGRIFAYMPAEAFGREAFEIFLDGNNLREKISQFKISHMPDLNWNAIWEKNYSPVKIRNTCIIRAPFHPPRKGFQYDLLISPKMSFGTAHHETTRFMIECILDYKWSGKEVLDFGCGIGNLTCLLAQAYTKSTVCGYEISDKSIKLANQKGRHLKNLVFTSSAYSNCF